VFQVTAYHKGGMGPGCGKSDVRHRQKEDGTTLLSMDGKDLAVGRLGGLKSAWLLPLFGEGNVENKVAK
jgi:hypothetical protein